MGAIKNLLVFSLTDDDDRGTTTDGTRALRFLSRSECANSLSTLSLQINYPFSLFNFLSSLPNLPVLWVEAPAGLAGVMSSTPTRIVDLTLIDGGSTETTLLPAQFPRLRKLTIQPHWRNPGDEHTALRRTRVPLPHPHLRPHPLPPRSPEGGHPRLNPRSPSVLGHPRIPQTYPCRSLHGPSRHRDDPPTPLPARQPRRQTRHPHPIPHRPLRARNAPRLENVSFAETTLSADCDPFVLFPVMGGVTSLDLRGQIWPDTLTGTTWVKDDLVLVLKTRTPRVERLKMQG